MKAPAKFLLPALILLGLAGAGCGAAIPEFAQVVRGPSVWIDKPLPDSQFPLDPIEVLAHASSPEGVLAFELSVDGEVVANNEVPAASTNETLVYMTQAWIPQGPGRYELSVRAMDGAGEYGPSASVFVTVDEAVQVQPTVQIFTPVPFVTATATEELACIFEAAINLFCREGPSSDHSESDSFTPGMTAPVVGESDDGNYWYVLGPNSGRACTVPKGERFGSTTGACSPLPQFTPPPLPPTEEGPTEQPPTEPSDDDGPGLFGTVAPSPTPIPPPS